MSDKILKEQQAIEDMQNSLKERKKKLAEMKKQEREKALQKLVKKLGYNRSIEVLENAISQKQKPAINMGQPQ